jgi:hypothetical protein
MTLREFGYELSLSNKAIVKILLTAFVVIGVGVLIFQITLGKLTAEEPIQQAKEYNPGMVACGQALTDAVHKGTGATYTFLDTCLAPGWEPR